MEWSFKMSSKVPMFTVKDVKEEVYIINMNEVEYIKMEKEKVYIKMTGNYTIAVDMEFFDTIKDSVNRLLT